MDKKTNRSMTIPHPNLLLKGEGNYGRDFIWKGGIP